MNGNEQFLGLVQVGEFHILAPYRSPGGSARLTRIFRQEARPPQSGELDLTEYEGKVIMVSGHLDSGWIYSATVIDQAGPILTVVVLEVFGQAST